MMVSKSSFQHHLPGGTGTILTTTSGSAAAGASGAVLELFMAGYETVALIKAMGSVS